MELKCQRCGHKDASYHMIESGKDGPVCSSMYKCLVRQMEKLTLRVETLEKK